MDNSVAGVAGPGGGSRLGTVGWTRLRFASARQGLERFRKAETECGGNAKSREFHTSLMRTVSNYDENELGPVGDFT